MEKLFFFYEEWFELGEYVRGFVFYNCTLKQPIGPHSVGEYFDCITTNYNEGVIELFLKGSDIPVFKAKLQLSIVSD